MRNDLKQPWIPFQFWFGCKIFVYVRRYGNVFFPWRNWTCCCRSHFADDINLLNYINSVKRMNKQVKQDLKNLKNRLNANYVRLNISKTEVVLFKSSRKLTDVPLKLKLSGKRLYPTNSVKHPGINIDENLTVNNRFLI